MPAATKEDVLRAIATGKLRVQNDGTCFFYRKTWCPCRPETVHGPHQRLGYHRIGFTLDGVRYRVLLHRAVWWAAGREIQNGLQINHKNGKKLDNRLTNLEVVTSSEDKLHAFSTGLIRAARGRASGPARTARLTDDQVHEIRASSKRQAELAQRYGITQSDVSRIRSRKRYAWVE